MADGQRDGNGHRGGILTLHPPNREPADGSVSAEGAGGELEGLFSSAFVASDREVAKVVEEVDEIAKALNVGAVGREVLCGALRPAVWSVVRHVLEEKELRSLLLTDDLTGLYNRRAFFASATQQLKLASRNGQGMLLFFCDLDNLKEINDRYGHREGDLALARTGIALQRVFRDADVLARLGGDEFAVLALDSSRDHEALMLRRLRKALQEANPSDSRYTLSLSVGFTRFDPEHPVSLGELIARADADMYEQKRTRSRLAQAGNERSA